MEENLNKKISDKEAKTKNDAETKIETETNIKTEEKENIEKKKTTSLNQVLKIAGVVLSAIMLIAGIVFVTFAIKLDIFTLNIILLLCIIVVLVTTIIVFFQRWTVAGIVTKILALFITALFIIGSFYLENTNRALEKMSGVTTQIDNMHVYVLNDSDFSSVQDLINAEYGVLETLDRENCDKAIEMIAAESGTELILSEYSGPLQLISALYNEETDAIIMNDSFVSMISETEGFEDLNNRIRSIWSIDIESDVKESLSQDNVSETVGIYENEVFTVYISGIDVKGSPMVNRNSDVNILMTVNTNTRQVLLINTPRDYYVPLSISNGERDKLTHAGCYGVEVSMETLGMLYDVDVNNYVKMNFTGFVEIIDILGGIEVYSDYSFTTDKGYHFNAGYNKLDGEEALAFARERHSFVSGDVQRGKNQMAVIEAVINKLVSSDILLDYNSVISAVSDSVATNVPYDDITDLVKRQLNDMREWDVITYSVTGTGSSEYTYSLSGKAYVMIPDQSTVNQAKEYLRQIYNNEIIEQIEEPTE